MTEMTPETLPTMPYGEGSRTCARACMAVLPPDDAMYQWLQIYLEHTAALQSRVEALEKRLDAARTAIGLDGAGRIAALNEGALLSAIAARKDSA